MITKQLIIASFLLLIFNAQQFDPDIAFYEEDDVDGNSFINNEEVPLNQYKMCTNECYYETVMTDKAWNIIIDEISKELGNDLYLNYGEINLLVDYLEDYKIKLANVMAEIEGQERFRFYDVFLASNVTDGEFDYVLDKYIFPADHNEHYKRSLTTINFFKRNK
jgi:hypothetical protein